jgi:1-acyl-sn-glycerol-3-phosphate acyltransferase
MTSPSLTLTERVVNTTIKGLTSLICRVDAAQLSRVPSQGPLIIISNHINFLDVPIIYTRLQPSPLTGFAKIETWDSPFLGPLFTMWGIIPVRRGEADMYAIRQGVNVLKRGEILAITPEGTRSGHGRLAKGHAGMVIMALLSGAPMLPVVHFGVEAYRQNLPRLRRTDFRIQVGRPFHLDPAGAKVTPHMREEMATEIMYQLASLLPPGYRGQYADLTLASQMYLRFIDTQIHPIS